MEEKVIEIISNILKENDIKLSVKEISDSTILTDDLGFESFNLAQLTVEIESEFGEIVNPLCSESPILAMEKYIFVKF